MTYGVEIVNHTSCQKLPTVTSADHYGCRDERNETHVANGLLPPVFRLEGGADDKAEREGDVQTAYRQIVRSITDRMSGIL